MLRTAASTVGWSLNAAAIFGSAASTALRMVTSLPRPPGLPAGPRPAEVVLQEIQDRMGIGRRLIGMFPPVARSGLGLHRAGGPRESPNPRRVASIAWPGGPRRSPAATSPQRPMRSPGPHGACGQTSPGDTPRTAGTLRPRRRPGSAGRRGRTRWPIRSGAAGPSRGLSSRSSRDRPAQPRQSRRLGPSLRRDRRQRRLRLAQPVAGFGRLLLADPPQDLDIAPPRAAWPRSSGVVPVSNS